MLIFSPLTLSNLVRYVHNMMGNFIQELCDQSRGAGGLPKRSFLITRGGGGSKTDHMIYEWPLICVDIRWFNACQRHFEMIHIFPV